MVMMRTTERMDVRRYFQTNETSVQLDKQREALLREMHNVGVTSEEYPKLLTYLERLTDVRKIETRTPISSDTIALIAGNLLGILLIIAYEQKHVLQSRGLSQLIRPK